MPNNTPKKIIIGHQLQANKPVVCGTKAPKMDYNQGSKQWAKPSVGIYQNGKFVRVPVK